jgi:hypothetical protein
MTLSARFSLLHSDLNDFLFAPVGDQQNGMPLNVISALIRLDVDPWKEAKRLAALPATVAAESLALMIARLPLSRPDPSDNLETSNRLVALLPRRGHDALAEDPQTTLKGRRYYRAVMLLACLAFGAVVLTVIF